MVKPTLILGHGFGLSPRYWDKLLPYFTDYHLIPVDFGYFTPTSLPKLSHVTSPCFALGHSLGWAKLENLDLNFNASVGLQAFRNFCGYAHQLRLKRLEEVQALQQFLARNPKSCLRYFYQRAGLPNVYLSSSVPNLNLLTNDLECLRSEFQMLNPHPKLILGTLDDPIVPPELIYDNFDKQPGVDYSLLPQGKHALGFNQAEIVGPIIQDFFRAHQQN